MFIPDIQKYIHQQDKQSSFIQLMLIRRTAKHHAGEKHRFPETQKSI